MKENTAYITDSLGQKYLLVEFFDHESQRWLTVLEYVPEEKSDVPTMES